MLPCGEEGLQATPAIDRVEALQSNLLRLRVWLSGELLTAADSSDVAVLGAQGRRSFGHGGQLLVKRVSSLEEFCSFTHDFLFFCP
jgi:hypothetical protein